MEVEEKITQYGAKQKIFSSPKGKISLVFPNTYTMNQYEIYCLEGELFDDIERFETEEEARERSEKLLS